MEPVYAPHKILAAQDDDDEDGERGGGGLPGTGNRLRAWHSSRIFRVSRASGGKDRHSKVLTAKGLRDRRVRLSVSTAIQFYDLQDRLGYDQPSKAVEWLIKAAADSIAELPSLDSKYPPPPETPKTQQSDDTSGEHQFEECYQQQQHQMLTNTKSPAACSSNSETSKGSSILSLSRSEIRVKARERARERAAKDKAKDDQESHLAAAAAHQNSHNSSSFTELLTGANNHTTSPPCHQHKHFASGGSTQMDYFPSGLLGHRNNFFSGGGGGGGGGGHNNFGMVPPFSTHHQQHHHEMQQFSFLSEHFIPQEAAGAVTGNDYNLNFSISSSGLAAYNRGTLQSNSPPPPQQQPQPLQRFPGNQDGPNMPFFIGANVAASADTQQQFGFDGRLQLCYGGGNGDGARHSDIKGKGKN